MIQSIQASSAAFSSAREWAQSGQRVRLNPVAEGIAASDPDGAFEMVSGPAVLPVDDCGPAEVVVAPAGAVRQAETLVAGERGLEERARLVGLS